MEMPIQVIMTLFVVLIVGSLVILFSQNLLNEADAGLPKFDKGSVEIQILEVDSVSSNQLGFLVDECYASRFGKVFKDETCFIVHSKNTYAISQSGIAGAVEAPLGVVDNGVSTKTIFVNWNFIDTKVDVVS